MYLVSDSLNIPYQMYPLIRGKRFAIELCGLPSVDVVLDISFVRVVEATFRSLHPLLVVKRLIDVELQRLYSCGIVDVEIEVINEMADVVAICNGIEVQHVG